MDENKLKIGVKLLLPHISMAMMCIILILFGSVITKQVDYELFGRDIPFYLIVLVCAGLLFFSALFAALVAIIVFPLTLLYEKFCRWLDE